MKPGNWRCSPKIGRNRIGVIEHALGDDEGIAAASRDLLKRAERIAQMHQDLPGNDNIAFRRDVAEPVNVAKNRHGFRFQKTMREPVAVELRLEIRFAGFQPGVALQLAGGRRIEAGHGSRALPLCLEAQKTAGGSDIEDAAIP